MFEMYILYVYRILFYFFHVKSLASEIKQKLLANGDSNCTVSVEGVINVSSMINVFNLVVLLTKAVIH